MLDRIANGRTDLVFDWIAAGNAATAEVDHHSLMLWCAYYGDVSAIRHLLAHGETLAGLGDNVGLNGAAYHGHWRLCQFALENGADPNYAEESGETPLHNALAKELPYYSLVVEVLLAAGADPNRATIPGHETGAFMRDIRTRGETPLHRAAAFGTERSIDLLIAAGARIDARDANGDSPLTWASWHHRPSHILAKLTFAGHRIHPDRVASSRASKEEGWRGMEEDLAGRPLVDVPQN